MTSGSADPDGLRAGTADRERVVSRLNEAFAEGRLEVGELDQRVAAAYSARTVGELRPLTVDLPGPDLPAPDPLRSPSLPPRPSVSGASVRMPSADMEPSPPPRVWIYAYRGWLTAFAVNVTVWLIVSLTSGHVAYPWPLWLLVPLVFGVAAGGRDSGPLDRRRRERRALRRSYREQRRRRR